MQALVLSLMLWIGNHSSYDTNVIPAPEIVELSATALTLEAYTDNPDKIPKDGIDERIFALYSIDKGPNGTIFITDPTLNEGWEIYDNPSDNPIFQERLLHELVHHTQRFSGVFERIPCRNFSEKEAYMLGGVFLKEHRTRDPMPNRNYFANMYSRC